MRHCLSAILLLIATAPDAFSQVLLHERFYDGSYADGDLVGQNGWVQYGAVSLNPIKIAAGRLVMPGFPVGPSPGAMQAASKGISPVNAPAVGTTVLYMSALLSVDFAPAESSYFWGMNTSAGFVNERISARATGAGFQFGARVTGQTSYPFFYGSELALNRYYNVVAKIELNAGNQNDRVLLFVDPTSIDLNSNANVYTIGQFVAGPNGDPLGLTDLVFSKFTSALVGQAGVSLAEVKITLDATSAIIGIVPEPSHVLLGLLAATAGMVRFRRFAWSGSRAPHLVAGECAPPVCRPWQ